MLPIWLSLPLQVQPPVVTVESTQTVSFNPSDANCRGKRSHVVLVPEMSRHSIGISIATSPVVVVLSEILPSAPSVQLPVTSILPTDITILQPRPKALMSAVPLSGRHELEANHTPATSPP